MKKVSDTNIYLYLICNFIDLKPADRSSLNALARQESRLKIREFNQRSNRKGSYESNSEESIDDDFLLLNINYDHSFLEIDRAPFTVMEETSLSKIHFLFTMLNLSQLFVIKKGVLVGIITKSEFLKKKKMVVQVSSDEKLDSLADKSSVELKPVIQVQMNPVTSTNLPRALNDSNV